MYKIFLEKAIFANRAPFDTPLELSFKENEITVLTAVNGKGKTTILSHIVDAFHEIAKLHFPNEFKGIEGQYYRVSSQMYNMVSGEPSFVYFRFATSDGHKIDYIDVRGDASGSCTSEQYDAAVKLEDKIAFGSFHSALLQNGGNVKSVAGTFDSKLIKEVFQQNLLTFFPAYRYEQPGYLNDPYKVELDFAKESIFSGYLPNPLEVTSGLRGFMNWILDVVLDIRLGNGEIIQRYIDNITYRNLCDLLSLVLHSKFDDKPTKEYQGEKIPSFRFGVGPRNSGAARISVYKNDEDTPPIYPTLTTLSSGESGLLCIFGELLRQADKINANAFFENIQGIVLIDEIDKHLHIKLQREVLPRLLSMFPNVQFVVTAHSPFFNIGLSEIVDNRTNLLSLPFGVSIRPSDDAQYAEVYDLMLKEDGRFKELAGALQRKIDEHRENLKPLIVTEGKTDVTHLEVALSKLDIDDLDIEFFDGVKDQGGTSQLTKLLEQQARVPGGRIIIGVFDRDDATLLREIEKDDAAYKHYGNNVYAICLPSLEENDRCSIEHYYPDSILKKESAGRRLFTGNEFYVTRQSKDGQFFAVDDMKFKVEVNGVIDNGIYRKEDAEGKTNVALSKSAFAKLIKHEDFAAGFDFEPFRKIFDRIKTIPGVANADTPKLVQN